MNPITRTDHTGRAIAWLLFGVAGGLGLDLCAKQILQTYSLSQFVLVRSLIGVTLFLAMAPRFFGGLRQLRTKRLAWHLLRTLLAVGAMYGFFYGLSEMPLIDALALGYTAPLMVTALSVPLLGEQVGWRRWAAVIGGFAGTLIILRPGGGQFSFASIAILFAAFCYACQAIASRHLATESLLSLSVYVVAGPLIVSCALIDGETWMPLDAVGWLLMTGAAIGSVIAWVGFLNGYRNASPSILAPFEYLAIIAGAAAGYVIWDEVPDIWVLVGAMVIIVSGLYVAYREIGLKDSAS